MNTDTKRSSAAADGVRAAESSPADDDSTVIASRYEINSEPAVIHPSNDGGSYAHLDLHFDLHAS
jgi:hypothetical protein